MQESLATIVALLRFAPTEPELLPLTKGVPYEVGVEPTRV